MNRRKTGTFYEKQAARYLESRGYEILWHSYRCRFGEIDLVARDGAYLVFVEVKYRSGRAMGEGSCAVDARKRAGFALLQPGILWNIICRRRHRVGLTWCLWMEKRFR